MFIVNLATTLFFPNPPPPPPPSLQYDPTTLVPCLVVLHHVILFILYVFNEVWPFKSPFAIPEERCDCPVFALAHTTIGCSHSPFGPILLVVVVVVFSFLVFAFHLVEEQTRGKGVAKI